MIDAVKNFLLDHQLIGDKSRLAYNVAIGRNFVFHVVAENGSFLTVKVGRTGGMEREYRSVRAAFEAFPEIVPAPLAFGGSQGLCMLAYKGVPHGIISDESLSSAGGRLVRGMRDYGVRSVQEFSTGNGGASHLEIFEQTLVELRDRELSDVVTGCVSESDRSRIGALPHVRQHGDLAVNNVGVTETGIVIFDWEDFGRVNLPGFDVAIFLSSCLKHDPARIRQWFERGIPEALEAVVQDACRTFEMDRILFRSMLPIYLCHFLNLKNKFGYGDIIKNQLRNTILNL